MSRDPLAPQFAELHAEVASIAVASILLALKQRILRLARGGLKASLQLTQRKNVNDIKDLSPGGLNPVEAEPLSDLVMRAAQLLAEIEQAGTAAEQLDRKLLH